MELQRGLDVAFARWYYEKKFLVPSMHLSNPLIYTSTIFICNLYIFIFLE